MLVTGPDAPERTWLCSLWPTAEHTWTETRLAVAALARWRKIPVRQHGLTSADPNGKIDQAFETVTHEHDQAVLGLQGAHFYREPGRIAELSIGYRLAGIFELFTQRWSREPPARSVAASRE
jgi:hypothetical protein